MFQFVCFCICIAIIKWIAGSDPKQGLGPILPYLLAGLLFSGFIGLSPLFILILVGLLIPRIAGGEKTPKKSGSRKNSKASARTAAPAGKRASSKQTAAQTGGSASYPGIPSSPKKRRKLVAEFNEVHALSLTEDEIDRIVEGSYLSADWAEEIRDMTEDYETVSAWYANGTPWLKAYLSAFQKQSISSDFLMQEQIVFDSFDQIFADVCRSPEQTVEEAVERINRKYLTRFNETTFTIAYRFLETKGKKYPLSFAQVYSVNEEIDDLLEKYSDRRQTRPMH